MLYHGRECYRKNASLILFNFFKNLLLVLPQLWFGFNNHFSSATIYDPWIYQLYNVAFTAFPIIAFAVFDQRHSKQTSLKEPQLYRVGLGNELFNVRAIATELSTPILYASCLSFVSYFALGASLDGSGYMLDMMGCGMAIFAECVIIANVKVLVLAHLPTPGLKILVLLGIWAFYACSFLEESVFPLGDMGNTLTMQMRSVNYWSVIAGTVGLVVMIEVIMGRWDDLL
jgi:phospholipid-transporting ATPase